MNLLNNIGNANELNRLIDSAYHLYNLNSLNRFQTTHRIHEENVAAHTFFVQTFVRLLNKSYVFDLHKALDIAYYHDCHESLIGDILQSAKNFSESLSLAADSADITAANKFDGFFEDTVSDYVKEYNKDPSEYSTEYLVVKAADILATILFLHHEVQLGNHSLDSKLQQKRDWFLSLNIFSKLKKKPHLFIIEGFDRVGKDYTLDYLNSLRDGVLYNYDVYKQHNKCPHYRHDKEAFAKWLKSFLHEQADELCGIDRNIVMARLFTSDYAYSSLFERTHYANEVFYQLKSHFNLHQIIITYNSYDEYVKRCEMLQCEVEYSKDEFGALDYLYADSIYDDAIDTHHIRIDAEYNIGVQKEIANKISEAILHGKNFSK